MPHAVLKLQRLHRGVVATLVGSAAIGLQIIPAQPKPLDAEACSQLKAKREALDASGIRQVLHQAKPSRGGQVTAEQAKNIRTLMEIEGQLRFRCQMELAITSFKPELVADVPDTVDDTGAVAPAAVKTGTLKSATAKPLKGAPKADNAKPDAVASNSKTATSAGTAGAAKVAASKPDAAAAIALAPETPVKPRTKPRAKTDDAYQATTGNAAADKASSQ